MYSYLYEYTCNILYSSRYTPLQYSYRCSYRPIIFYNGCKIYKYCKIWNNCTRVERNRVEHKRDVFWLVKTYRENQWILKVASLQLLEYIRDGDLLSKVERLEHHWSVQRIEQNALSCHCGPGPTCTDISWYIFTLIMQKHYFNQ